MDSRYREFLSRKHVRMEATGVPVPTEGLNQRLFDWQKSVVQWALRTGRAALFADCGLGKTFMQLEWLSQLWECGEAPQSLLLCPIAVAEQTLSEHERFGIACPARIVESSGDVGDGINITNYEKLHKFDASRFRAVVLDESSILKSYTGATKRMLCEMFAATPFRLACTATPAPNDLMELGNHSEFLGVLPSSEMLSRWFINDGASVGHYRLRRHAVRDYWAWVSSWACAVSKPSDLGDYSDEGYVLPPLCIHEYEPVDVDVPSGHLFHPGRQVSATTVHIEKRGSLRGKVRAIADLVDDGELWVCWVDTDYEADAILKAVPDAVDVRGSYSESEKHRRLTAFTRGDIRVMVTKPEIGGFGLNWQHCCNMTYMAGFSYERWYQSVRRLWRFGQKRPVHVHLLMGVTEEPVKRVWERKALQHAQMGAELVRQVNAAAVSGPSRYTPSETLRVPQWIQTGGLA